MHWNIFHKYSQTILLHFVITVLVAWLLLQEFVCVDDIDLNMVRCRPKCNYGKFSLFGMTYCYPWLTCSEIENIHVTEEIGCGAVKQVGPYILHRHASAMMFEL